MDLIIIVNAIFRILSLLILARVILSFFRFDPYNPIIRFIYETTEPILGPIRKIMPDTGMFDFSPMVAWFIIGALQRIVLSILMR